MPKNRFSVNFGEKVVAVLVGNSGSGKSTLARYLGYLGVGFGYLGTGDLLRAEEASNSAFAKIIASYTTTGEHVPKEIILPWVAKWLERLAKNRLILADGFPRNMGQVDDAFHLFHQHGYLKVATIYVNTPPEVCSHRLLLQAAEAQKNGCQRNDGEEAAMTNRLRAFDEKVKPVLDVLRDRCGDFFVEVDTTVTSLTDIMEVRDVALRAGLIS